MIGDVMRIQRTPRLTPAVCSQTWFWSVCFPLRAAAFTGSGHLIWTYCESREHRVGASRSLLFWVMELIIANDRVKLYNFKFVAYTDIYRVWSGRYLLFPKSEPDLTVDLKNCVIDASSRCGLSLAARFTVEPARHSGACH